MFFKLFPPSQTKNSEVKPTVNRKSDREAKYWAWMFNDGDDRGDACRSAGYGCIDHHIAQLQEKYLLAIHAWIIGGKSLSSLPAFFGGASIYSRSWQSPPGTLNSNVVLMYRHNFAHDKANLMMMIMMMMMVAEVYWSSKFDQNLSASSGDDDLKWHYVYTWLEWLR